MENKSLLAKYMQALNTMPNMTTDEKADAGRRTYQYLNLGTLCKKAKETLNAAGVMFYQNIKKEDDGNITIQTIIFDEKETMTVSTYPVQFVADSQALGSAITYARRYSLYSALGIYPDKDDDGAAMRDYAQKHTQQQTPNMLMQLIQHYRDKGVSLKATASALMGRDIQTPSEIPANLYKQLYNMI